jgi:hypothetical protein
MSMVAGEGGADLDGWRPIQRGAGLELLPRADAAQRLAAGQRTAGNDGGQRLLAAAHQAPTGAPLLQVPLAHQLLAVNFMTLLDAAFMSWARTQDNWSADFMAAVGLSSGSSNGSSSSAGGEGKADM